MALKPMVSSSSKTAPKPIARCIRGVGSIGHIGAWSFCQDKIVTTGGEGGMVVTNDNALWTAMWSYKDHGKSREGVYKRQHPPGPRLVHDSFGTNWRMLEMQAAIELLQLDRMSDWTDRRTWGAEEIGKTLAGRKSILLPSVPNYTRHAYYRLYGFVRPEALAEGWSRDRIIDEIVAAGLPCMHGSQSEVYLEGAFEGTGWRPQSDCQTRENLAIQALLFWFIQHCPTMRSI